MSKWRRPSEALGELLAEATAELDCEPRRMFGCPCYFVNNNMFVGIHQETVILRLSPDDREEIQAQYDEVGSFDPMGGRPMREYMAIPEELMDDDAFSGWLDRSYGYASSLPPKEKKQRKPRR